MKRTAIAVAILSCALSLTPAAQPPSFLNYQGVLRGTDGAPLDGTFPMIFRFYGVETGGQPILADQHEAVTVVAGLFSVRVGSGVVSDGAAPGTYVDVANVFADYQPLFLELEISGEVLAPRTPFASGGYALNARTVNGVEVAAPDALDLYVDAFTGNDDNDGLERGTPKRTIQAAIDRIPSILRGDVTVHINPGTYAESVALLDRDLPTGSSITLRGEAPGVRITGERSRPVGLEIRSVRDFVIENLEVTDTTSYNVQTNDASGTIRSCVLTSTASPSLGAGILVSRGFVTVEQSTLSNHAVEGIVCSSAARCFLNDVTITGNSRGIDVLRGSMIRFVGRASVTGNSIGCRAFGHGQVDFGYRADVQVTGNAGYDLQARFLGAIYGYVNATVGTCVPLDNSVCSPTY